MRLIFIRFDCIYCPLVIKYYNSESFLNLQIQTLQLLNKVSMERYEYNAGVF